MESGGFFRVPARSRRATGKSSRSDVELLRKSPFALTCSRKSDRRLTSFLPLSQPSALPCGIGLGCELAAHPNASWSPCQTTAPPAPGFSLIARWPLRSLAIATRGVAASREPQSNGARSESRPGTLEHAPQEADSKAPKASTGLIPALPALTTALRLAAVCATEAALSSIVVLHHLDVHRNRQVVAGLASEVLGLRHVRKQLRVHGRHVGGDLLAGQTLR